MLTPTTQLISFAGKIRIAAGNPFDVAMQTKAYSDSHPAAQILVFDSDTGRPVELDLRGGPEDVQSRLSQQGNVGVRAAETDVVKPGRGRPRLGVSAREVTLMPRHWEWLASQPGGASVSLRKLVEKAMRDNREIDLKRDQVESAYRFMLAMAGDETGFEAASRALFADDMDSLPKHMEKWPEDIRGHCLVMLERHSE